MHPKERGFTLIEIIIVLVLLGILAAVAVPKYFDLQEQAYIQAAKAAVAETQARVNLLFGQLLLAGTDMSGKDIVTTKDGVTITRHVVGYKISTLFQTSYVNNKNLDYSAGLADSIKATDSNFDSGGGTGRIGGWRVEMQGTYTPPKGQQVAAKTITFCEKNGATTFPIKRMVAPDDTVININIPSGMSAPNNNNATTITVPADQQKFFYISVPECIK